MKAACGWWKTAHSRDLERKGRRDRMGVLDDRETTGGFPEQGVDTRFFDDGRGTFSGQGGCYVTNHIIVYVHCALTHLTKTGLANVSCF